MPHNPQHEHNPHSGIGTRVPRDTVSASLGTCAARAPASVQRARISATHTKACAAAATASRATTGTSTRSSTGTDAARARWPTLRSSSTALRVSSLCCSLPLLSTLCTTRRTASETSARSSTGQSQRGRCQRDGAKRSVSHVQSKRVQLLIPHLLIPVAQSERGPVLCVERGRIVRSRSASKVGVKVGVATLVRMSKCPCRSNPCATCSCYTQTNARASKEQKMMVIG
jgi:hypothetical protein